jgi:hypothetical protein
MKRYIKHDYYFEHLFHPFVIFSTQSLRTIKRMSSYQNTILVVKKKHFCPRIGRSSNIFTCHRYNYARFEVSTAVLLRFHSTEMWRNTAELVSADVSKELNVFIFSCRRKFKRIFSVSKYTALATPRIINICWQQTYSLSPLYTLQAVLLVCSLP